MLGSDGQTRYRMKREHLRDTGEFPDWEPFTQKNIALINEVQRG